MTQILSNQAQTEVSRVRQMADVNSQPEPVVTNTSIDFTKSQKVADQVREWSKIKSTDLYNEARERGVDPIVVLEELDPTPTTLDGKKTVPLDALERCLYLLEQNPSTMTVDQFYSGPAMILLPSLISRWVQEGITIAAGAMNIYAVDRRVSGLTAHPLYLEGAGSAEGLAKAPLTSVDEKRLGSVGNAGLPVTKVGHRDKAVKVGTYGRDMLFDYKFVKYASLQELRILFNYVGLQMAYDDVGNVFEIVDSGDGVSGGPPSRLQISGSTGSGTLTFGDLTSAIVQMQGGGYRVSHWVGEANSLIDFLNLSQFSGANYRDTTLRELLTTRGPLTTPLGMLLISPNPPADADHLAFIDAGFALGKVEEQPLTVEADKVIQGLFEEIAIHGSWAFYKFMNDASGMIDYS